MSGQLAALRVGDRVLFDGRPRLVAGLAGMRVRLVDDGGAAQVILLSQLLAAPGFELLDSTRSGRRLAPLGLLDGLPAAVVERARSWEGHVIEVETGLPAGAQPGMVARPEYDPARRSLAERDAAKAAELTAAGQKTSAGTVKRMRLDYRAQGLWGLVDQRLVRTTSPYGRVDARVVAAVAKAIDMETLASTGTRSRLRRRVEQLLAAEHGAGTVALPPSTTFYRLVTAMSQGKHTFGAATSRRSQADRPERPFTRTFAVRPGEQVQLDTTPLDVMAILEEGVPGRIELSISLDIATRTICAGVLRPAGTKAVDAALLLARTLVPEPMRPGWPQALHMARSRIPHARLLSIDARLEHAAARPAIVPETVVVDRGRVYLSETFIRACENLGISVQPTHPASGWEKGTVERTFESINTLFCQHVAGYVGSNVTRRGKGSPVEPVWSLAQLQDLFDEWVVHWQSRPHEGLRDPDVSANVLSPNEMYAAAVSATGYVTMPLTGDDYLELLPVQWRSITDQGIQIDYRHYDCRELNPYRHQTSGVVGKNGRWEVHNDPYDLSHVWVRNHRDGGWITVPWTHLPMVGQPFADFTWRTARQMLSERGADATDETAIAQALDELLTRAGVGPKGVDRRQRRVAARTKAISPNNTLIEESTLDQADLGDAVQGDAAPDHDAPMDKVIPFGVFDPAAKGRYR